MLMHTVNTITTLMVQVVSGRDSTSKYMTKVLLNNAFDKHMRRHVLRDKSNNKIDNKA